MNADPFDGLWQTLMLAGVMEAVSMTEQVLSYEVSAYYGMIVFSFESTS